MYSVNYHDNVLYSVNKNYDYDKFFYARCDIKYLTTRRECGFYTFPAQSGTDSVMSSRILLYNVYF
jgi:hypothetical protein